MAGDVRALIDQTTAAHTLLEYLSESLRMVARLSNSSCNQNLTVQRNQHLRSDPLYVLGKLAALLKARITKLSLMILNQPFGAKSIKNEVKEITETCVTGMVGAVHDLRSTYPIHSVQDTQHLQDVVLAGDSILLKEVSSAVARVIEGVSSLIEEVRRVSESELGEHTPRKLSRSANEGISKGGLTTTGIVLSACEAIIELQKYGIPGLVCNKADLYLGLLSDAIEELQDWAEDTKDEDADDASSDTTDAVDESLGSDDGDGLDVFFQAANPFAKADDALQQEFYSAMGKLRKIQTFHQVLIKRRFEKSLDRTNPGDTSKIKNTVRYTDHDIDRIERVLSKLKSMSEITDEVVHDFYSLDCRQASEHLEQCCYLAVEAAEMARCRWGHDRDQADDFAAWVDDWKQSLEDSR